jgi:hypothetical protein
LFGLIFLIGASVAALFTVVWLQVRGMLLDFDRIWKAVAESRGFGFRRPSLLETLAGGSDDPLLTGPDPERLTVRLVGKPGKWTHLSGLSSWIPDECYLSISRRPSRSKYSSFCAHGLVAEWHPETFRSRLSEEFLGQILQRLSTIPTFSWCSIEGRDDYRDQPKCTISLKGRCGDRGTLEKGLDALETVCNAQKR